MIGLLFFLTEDIYAVNYYEFEPLQFDVALDESLQKGLPSSERTDDLKVKECLDVNQTLNLSYSSFVSTPSISVSNNNVFVVWEEGKGGKSSIVYRHSNDSGITFGPATSISSDDDDVQNNSSNINIKDEDIKRDSAIQPDITSTAENVYIVWKSLQSGIQLKHSNDSGITFGPATTLTNDTSVSDLKLAASGDNVYIVWKDIVNGNPTIFFKKSPVNAKVFDPVLKLTGVDMTGYGPDIQVAGQNKSIFAVWNSADNGIGFAFSKDGGVDFESVDSIQTQEAGVSDLKLAVSGEDVYLVWKQEGTFMISKFHTNESSFTKPLDIKNIAGKNINLWGSNSIDIGADGSNLYSVWVHPVYIHSEPDSSYHAIYYSGFNTNLFEDRCSHDKTR